MPHNGNNRLSGHVLSVNRRKNRVVGFQITRTVLPAMALGYYIPQYTSGTGSLRNDGCLGIRRRSHA